MISRTWQEDSSIGCGQVSLDHALESGLTATEESHLQVHLEGCELCRRAIDRKLNGESCLEELRELEWFTKDVDSDLVRPRVGDSTEFQHIEKGDSQAWIRSLLDDPTEDGTIGKWQDIPIRRVIGQGGMGVVLEGEDVKLSRSLAIKLLSPMLSSQGAARQRFYREARAAASINHPNIVPIYSVESEAALPFLTMPFIGGGSLQCKINGEGPLTLEESIQFALQVAEGLSAAHEQGIVHRDIKPANLLLDEGGFRLLITDFGLARAIDDASLTLSGVIAGTPGYMSPEQAKGEVLDARSDIYSLGAVLYAMLTGHPPFKGQSTLHIIQSLANSKPPQLTTHVDMHPAWVQKLIDQLMAPKREARICTANETVEILRLALAHVRSPQKNPLPLSLKNKGWNVRWVAAYAATMILMAMCFAAYVFQSGFKEPNFSPNRQGPPRPSPDASKITDEHLAIDGMLPSRPANTAREMAAGTQLRRDDGLEWDSPELDRQIAQLRELLQMDDSSEQE